MNLYSCQITIYIVSIQWTFIVLSGFSNRFPKQSAETILTALKYWLNEPMDSNDEMIKKTTVQQVYYVLFEDETFNLFKEAAGEVRRKTHLFVP